MDYPWYDVAEGEGLQQGDFLRNCPVLVPKGPVGTETKIKGEIVQYDVAVMSQSCDLEQDKLDLVLVCPHWALEDAANQQPYLKATNAKEQLRRGNLPGYHLIAACELPDLKHGLRVVDFRTTFAIPAVFLRQFAKENGKRPRLLPLYREHLSQSFARFFMRVGLPVDIPAFK
jgi:hypothetical protein